MNVTPLKKELRPGELVRRFLEERYLAEGEVGGRLPTLEEIALHLGVGKSTVRTVIGRYVEEGVLASVPGRGTYVMKGIRIRSEGMVLATNLQALGGEAAHIANWSETIYLAAVKRAGEMGRGIRVLPVVGGGDAKGVHRELLKQMGEVDMVLLFPCRGREEVQRKYEAAGKIAILVNPPEVGATRDFVSSDYYHAGKAVGEAFYEAGNRRFLFLGPVNVKESISSRLLVYGYGEGTSRDLDRKVEFAVRACGIEPGGEDLKKMLSGVPFSPEVIFCAGDKIGWTVWDGLKRRGYKIPREVRIIAATGMEQGDQRGRVLTRVLQPMERVGQRAVDLLCQRWDQKLASVTGEVFPAGILLGNTTRDAENKILKCKFN